MRLQQHIGHRYLHGAVAAAKYVHKPSVGEVIQVLRRHIGADYVWAGSKKDVLDILWRPVVAAAEIELLCSTQVPTLLYCMVKLEIDDESTFHRLVRRASAVASSLHVIQIAMVLWTMAQVKCDDLIAAEALISQFRRNFAKADARTCTKFAYSLHLLGW